MTKNNQKALFAELKTVKTVLRVFTALNIVVFILSLINILNISSIITLIVYYTFILYFLRFLWFKIPTEKIDKIGETILILVFGVFALWMWIPDKKELKETINKNELNMARK